MVPLDSMGIKTPPSILDVDWLRRRIDSAPRAMTENRSGIKPASVFLLLFDKDEAPHLLTILKTDTKGYPWRNQIALPGGHVEDNDRSPLETAFRELREEVGIDAHNITVAGSLGHFPTIKDTVIEAFVAVWNGSREELAYDPKEIARVIEVPVRTLRETHKRKGFSERDPGIGELVYPYDNRVIWGVTARILYFFIEHIAA